MRPEDQLEREEDELYKQFEAGVLSLKEYEDERRDLHRSYRGEAEESARDAYERELERW